MKIISGMLLTTGCLLVGSADAMNFGDMMNPSKWMGGNSNRDRYDDGYYGGGPGWGGYPGYGYPGYGYGGYPGYGYPGYGYGGYPGYGYGGGYPGYGGGSNQPIIVTPQSNAPRAAPREIR